MEAEREVSLRGEVCSETKQPRGENRRKETFVRELQDERWLLRRRSAIARVGSKCQECGKGGRLEVHHLYYVKGKRVWQYPYKALKVFCRSCHEKWHKYNRLEYREEIWSSLKEYQAPKKRKIYFVKKGGYSVQKEEPYKKVKKPYNPTPVLTKKQRLKVRRSKLKAQGKLSKMGFAPRSKKRLEELNIATEK